MDELLKQLGFTNNKIDEKQLSALLTQSAESLICGPACQKQKITEQLKQKYLDAETKVQTAPLELERSKKNYLIYTEGRPYYDNLKEQELQKKADAIGVALEEAFQEQWNRTNTMNLYLNTALINSEHTKQLLHELEGKNALLLAKEKESYGDILTNDRKTYYELDALSRLKNWYTLYWYLYYLLVLSFVFYLFFYTSQMSRIQKTILSVLLVFYPYYIDYIVRWLKSCWYWLKRRLPKNVYNTL